MEDKLLKEIILSHAFVLAYTESGDTEFVREGNDDGRSAKQLMYDLFQEINTGAGHIHILRRFSGKDEAFVCIFGIHSTYYTYYRSLLRIGLAVFYTQTTQFMAASALQLTKTAWPLVKDEQLLMLSK